MPEDALEQDQSLEQNMIAALIESRARYKDFVETFSDFAWETGPEGTERLLDELMAIMRDEVEPAAAIEKSPATSKRWTSSTAVTYMAATNLPAPETPSS